MRWEVVTRHLQVRVEEEIYRQLEAAAAARRSSLTAIGLEAIVTWLAGGQEPARLGKVTKREEDVLSAVLELLRDSTVPADDPRTIKPTLLELGKRYAARRPA